MTAAERTSVKLRAGDRSGHSLTRADNRGAQHARAPWQSIAADGLDAAFDVRVERVRVLQQLVVTDARRDERRPDGFAVADEQGEGSAVCGHAREAAHSHDEEHMSQHAIAQ